MTTPINVVRPAGTAIARICERWTMSVDLPPVGQRAHWFLDYALRSPRDAGKHLTAGWWAYASLLSVYGPEDIDSAHECFGGIGAQSLMIQELFAPEVHTVGEWAIDGVDHLRRALPDHIEVYRRDAYADGLPEAQLYGLDFGDLTVWRTKKDDTHRSLLNRTFSNEPRAVVFTDIACRYLHLHRARYESLLGKGTCGSYPDYLRALLQRVEILFDYTLVRGYYDRWSAVMALVPLDLKDRVPGELLPTPVNPVGLEIV